MNNEMLLITLKSGAKIKVKAHFYPINEKTIDVTDGEALRQVQAMLGVGQAIADTRIVQG